MPQRRQLVLALLAALLLASCRARSTPFNCGDAIGCVDIAPTSPIRIGALQALSGDMGPQGQDLLQCIELALDDHDGKLLGHPLELYSADSRCSAEGGTTAALQVSADPQIVGIIGPTCSGAAATAMKVVSEAGLVMVSGSCSAPSLTSVGGKPGPNWRPGFFRTAQNDALVGQSAAAFAFQELGVTRAATINDGDPYTRGLTDSFEQAFGELGGELALSAAVNKGDTDMRPVLAAIAASRAELIFFPVFRMEGDYIVLQAREIEALWDVTLMSAEGLYLESFIQAVDEAGVGTYFIAPTTPGGPAYAAFVSSYESKYRDAPSGSPYRAQTYDATKLLLNAIEAAAVREHDGTLHIGRQALRDTLHATSEYQGLTGSLTCDPYGDCGAMRLQVTRLDDPDAGIEGLATNVIRSYPADQ